MDESTQLKAEWERKQVAPVLKKLYHDIWVYGLGEMGSPIEGLGLDEEIEQKISFTGYLDREVPSDRNWVPPIDIEEPYLLVTAGGGGDGVDLIDWVIRAYEAAAGDLQRAVIVTGPFMPTADQQRFHERCEALANVDIITFDTHLELLMKKATAVVAMGGYNTFCEILTLDKPALIVPRSVPRQEQLIRAERALRLGLIQMLNPAAGRDVSAMINALRKLAHQARPSSRQIDGLLSGHDNIAEMVRQYLEPEGQLNSASA